MNRGLEFPGEALVPVAAVILILHVWLVKRTPGRKQAALNRLKDYYKGLMKYYDEASKNIPPSSDAAKWFANAIERDSNTYNMAMGILDRKEKSIFWLFVVNLVLFAFAVALAFEYGVLAGLLPSLYMIAPLAIAWEELRIIDMTQR